MVDFATFKLTGLETQAGAYLPSSPFGGPTFTGAAIPSVDAHGPLITFAPDDITATGQKVSGTIAGVPETFTYEGFYGDASNPVYVFSLIGGLPGSAIAVSPFGNHLLSLFQPLHSGVPAEVCFLAGSLIATPDGDVAVERLSVGDLVCVRLHGETVTRPVTWIGNRSTTVDPKAHHDAYPVRIRAGALGDGLPYADLLVTSEHCLHLEGGLIPARMLVNGRSIIADTTLAAFQYFHVELEDHAILLANGIETESYLDTGNRGNFANAGTVDLRPAPDVDATSSRWTSHAAAPLVVDRETVEPIWTRLNQRAIASGLPMVAQHALVDAPELRLLTDGGARISPALIDGDTYRFVVPAGVRSLHLLSRASRPSDVIGPFVDDRRAFGVLVGGIGIVAGSDHRSVDGHLADQALAGWHQADSGATCRWTNGHALLPIDLSTIDVGSIALDIQILSAGPYAAPVVPAALAA